MIKILQIVSSLKRNGTETFIMNVFRNIDRSKVMFDFLVFSNEKEGFYDEIKALGGEIYSLPKRRNGFINYHKALDSFFKSHSKDYDIVHYNVSSLTSVAPLYYAKKYGITRRIVHCHNANCSGLHNQIIHRINRFRIHGLATDYLACSGPAGDWGYTWSGARNKVNVITNGIELSNFSFDPILRRECRDELNIANKVVFLHIGTFNPIKNHEFLLKTFSKIKSKCPNAVLICVGEGQLFNDIKKEAETLNLSDEILFLGRRTDIPRILNAADVMIFPSKHEGLGIAVVEALASSLPCLVSTGVPKDLEVSSKIKFLPLSSGYGNWANEAIQLSSIKRESSIDEGVNIFSIDNTVAQMENIYLNSNCHG